jgi:hypothetical protein
MSLASISSEALETIRAAGLERVIVPLDDDPRGYENVLQVAAACGTGQVVGLHVRNEEVPLDVPASTPASGGATDRAAASS